jgi:TPR repeat protein
MTVRRGYIGGIVVSLFLSSTHLALAQGPPEVPQQYRRLFYYNNDQRDLLEKALNKVGQTKFPVGRSFALIAGVTQYPNFPPLERDLKPAQVDIEKLKSYLKDQEYFDQIVVLKDGDMNLDTLNYFLESYFPEQLKKSPHSRFLFAYSGHGYAESLDESARGFVLTSPATTKTDPINRIDLSTIRGFLTPDVDAAEKLLVLVNACQSGAFLGRKAYGANPLGPGDRGAYAIMASRTSQQSLSLSSVGPGSVFFEKVFAGLSGIADKSPNDGVVTYHELDTYLHSEIPYATNGAQMPMEGDISKDGSIGEFFFLNRGRQVQIGNTKPWNPGTLVSFGAEAGDILARGQKAYSEQRYSDAAQAFTEAAAAGNPTAMFYLGYQYDEGLGVQLDYQMARQWYERAAEAGNASAMGDLGYLYDFGHGVPQDYKLAFQWYQKGAVAGEIVSMRHLGYLYHAGHGVSQDYEQARQWFEKAAAGGDATAMYNLGVLYDQGQGVSQDYKQARQWYEKAATAGEPTAMYNLGILYELGHGVAVDIGQARQWYEKAAAAGYADANKRLQQLKK